MANAESFSIRNGITFGMTKAEVKKAETLKPSSEGKDGSFLTYKYIQIAGIKKSILEYLFKNNKLNSINMFLNDGATKLLLERDYKALSSSLKDKYGKPLGYKNGETADLTSDYFFAMKVAADADKLLGGKKGYKITYDEWLIPTKGGKVKIEHILITAKSDKNCTHALIYTFFSNQVNNGI
jgi:hypothetical protein